jgi:hypothetical protein
MYAALEKDENLDRDKKEVQNLMGAVENRARHVPTYEQNYDYNAFRDLYKVIVEGGHKLKINQKHLSYNSLSETRIASGLNTRTLRRIWMTIHTRRTTRIY